MTITVVVADDQALVRGGFSVLLNSAPDIDVVGEAGDGGEAVDIVLRERPDVVLMDIRMPVIDGIEATRRIIADERTAATKVLIVTTFDLDEYVYDGLRAGARPDPMPGGLEPSCPLLPQSLARTLACRSAAASPDRARW